MLDRAGAERFACDGVCMSFQMRERWPGFTMIAGGPGGYHRSDTSNFSQLAE
ncbi:hypothetical protein PROFUN_07785 [Planoprotostelium fungivorum]|uniref:Uncharacterized protein n=1 Tax=Planoprotostelium fungivorum TaxID=1890364 RepID=A0A2P6MX52_9EUKA|nr:hypothetical protein PROFUN_07785 [Planoprotostelium fungivorum]